MKLSILNDNAVQEYSGCLEEDVQQFNTIKKADGVIYKTSKPSKMPGHAYGLPASKCKTGSKLRNVEGSVCYGCYAADDWEWAKQTKRYTNYAFDNVKNANQKRFEAIRHPMWVPAMVAVIRKRKLDYFRWHDTGDIQSVEHLENIAKVCRATSDTNHWIPTREYNIVRKWRKVLSQPINMCIRASAHMIDGFAPKDIGPSSIVSKTLDLSTVFECRAYTRNAKCGDCRACWNNKISTVAYPYH